MEREGERKNSIFSLKVQAHAIYWLNFKIFLLLFKNGAPQGPICSLFSFTKSSEPFNLQNGESKNRSKSHSNLQ